MGEKYLDTISIRLTDQNYNHLRNICQQLGVKQLPAVRHIIALEVDHLLDIPENSPIKPLTHPFSYKNEKSIHYLGIVPQEGIKEDLEYVWKRRGWDSKVNYSAIVRTLIDEYGTLNDIPPIERKKKGPGNVRVTFYCSREEAAMIDRLLSRNPEKTRSWLMRKLICTEHKRVFGSDKPNQSKKGKREVWLLQH